MADRSPEDIVAQRARRAERRQKQREANVSRAEKMHQARIDPDQNTRCHSDEISGRIYIGCSGWYYWHWKGKFYPPDTPSNQWFQIYQANFQTVELNAPFYSWPTIAAVKTWLRQAKQSFVYTIRVCELITHVKRFQDTADWQI